MVLGCLVASPCNRVSSVDTKSVSVQFHLQFHLPRLHGTYCPKHQGSGRGENDTNIQHLAFRQTVDPGKLVGLMGTTTL